MSDDLLGDETRRLLLLELADWLKRQDGNEQNQTFLALSEKAVRAAVARVAELEAEVEHWKQELRNELEAEGLEPHPGLAAAAPSTPAPTEETNR